MCEPIAVTDAKIEQFKERTRRVLGDNVTFEVIDSKDINYHNLSEQGYPQKVVIAYVDGTYEKTEKSRAKFAYCSGHPEMSPEDAFKLKVIRVSAIVAALLALAAGLWFLLKKRRF
jgi:hypothetical protein